MDKIKRLYRKMANVTPLIFYLIQYRRAIGEMGNCAQEANRLFELFISDSEEGKCLQIGVKDNVGKKYGDNWVSVDKYDKRGFIDYHYDIHNLGFPDSCFDAVACISVLEHVSNPQEAIKELHRVLKPGGKIWVQLPFHFPYHEAPKDYWRASPDGLRVWMDEFDEISCGSFLWTRTSLVTTTYYYGVKPCKAESSLYALEPLED